MRLLRDESVPLGRPVRHLRITPPYRRYGVARCVALVYCLALALLADSLRFGACPMPDDLSTSTAVERERVRVVRSQLYLTVRLRELYTPGAAEPRDAASRDREVVSGNRLRCWRPNPVQGDTGYL